MGSKVCDKCNGFGTVTDGKGIPRRCTRCGGSGRQ